MLLNTEEFIVMRTENVSPLTNTCGTQKKKVDQLNTNCPFDDSPCFNVNKFEHTLGVSGVQGGSYWNWDPIQVVGVGGGFRTLYRDCPFNRITDRQVRLKTLPYHNCVGGR